MEQRIYHGNLLPNDIARALIAKFNRGNIVTQQLGNQDQVVVQITTRRGASAGGDTAMSITIQKVEDGVSVQVGKQAWLGVAASLGKTALLTMHNPFNLLGRLDDIAQDIENLNISQQVWETIAEVARARGAAFELSERLRRLVCAYCDTANPIGEPNCIACGAPLGPAQPSTCKYCGFVIKPGESVCPNCKRAI
ncbi:MAG: zinc ribbon domain-containing protein [Anaerolineales bacterium]|nr:zinc ribbon domain-containing protein [Anaerolineales bacterium]